MVLKREDDLAMYLVLLNFFRDTHNLWLFHLWSSKLWPFPFWSHLVVMQSSENVRVFEIFNPGRSILSLRNTFSNFMSKHQVERENAYIIYSAPEKDEQKFLSFHSHSAGSSVLQFPSNNPMFWWERGESIAQWGEGTWIGMQTTSEVWHKHTASHP